MPNILRFASRRPRNNQALLGTAVTHLPPAKAPVLNAGLSTTHGPKLILLWIALSFTTLWPGWLSAQTAPTNATEAQIANLFTSQQLMKPLLYVCQTGIYDDLGNLDGDLGHPPSPGRITSAAWDLGDNRYLYAYQLSNPNGLDDDAGFDGGWDVGVFGHSSGLRIPLRRKQIIPVDYNGDQVLDTSFRTTDFACNAMYHPPGDCAPFTGPFKVFTAGTDDCARSWSDYIIDYGGVSNDEIVDAFVNLDAAGLSAEFAVEYDPAGEVHGVARSTQVFGFVSDAPPDYVDGVNLGGASASIRLVAPDAAGALG
jgi:hypothetical protein